ncbi:MAG: hypothetical protein M4579_006862 [Chaenotheca gracillima]|nr:MAG: hypothetical protein M4579_006862 [Chaenotheca gracillima]
MHFALPPRKTSHPPPYAPRSSRSPFLRKSRSPFLLLILCCILVIAFLFLRLFTATSGPPPGTPSVVIVTPLDHKAYSKEYLDKIQENRIYYAEQHGYKCFFPSVADYDLAGAPMGWARVPATRHAMTLNPHSTFFFHLSQNSLIMNPSLSIEDHVMSVSRLEEIMLRDKPVVPPDSVIKTFPHLRGENVDLVLTQDSEGLSQGSFILRQGDWSKFFLDTWFDPLYRAYNFQKAEGHALEHVVQWHPTILAKLALVPQRLINSYNNDSPGHDDTILYADNDFVIHLSGCKNNARRDCESELETFYRLWKSNV